MLRRSAIAVECRRLSLRPVAYSRLLWQAPGGVATPSGGQSCQQPPTCSVVTTSTPGPAALAPWLIGRVPAQVSAYRAQPHTAQKAITETSRLLKPWWALQPLPAGKGAYTLSGGHNADARPADTWPPGSSAACRCPGYRACRVQRAPSTVVPAPSPPLCRWVHRCAQSPSGQFQAKRTHATAAAERLPHHLTGHWELLKTAEIAPHPVKLGRLHTVLWAHLPAIRAISPLRRRHLDRLRGGRAAPVLLAQNADRGRCITTHVARVLLKGRIILQLLAAGDAGALRRHRRLRPPCPCAWHRGWYP